MARHTCPKKRCARVVSARSFWFSRLIHSKNTKNSWRHKKLEYVRTSLQLILLTQLSVLAVFLILNKDTSPLVSSASADEVAGSENSQTMEVLGTDAFAFATSYSWESALAEEGVLVPDVGSSGSARDVYEIPAVDLVTTYIVRDGDTLESVAKTFNISTNTIKWANALSGNTLKAGQELTILPVSGIRYTVRSGDTLKSIAAKYKGDIDDIASFNDIGAADVLAVGETVIIPDGEMSDSGQSIPRATAKRSGTTATSGYYVRPVAGIVTQWFHGPHEAVDVGAPTGTPIYAMASGVVKVARDSGYNGGYGKLVVIEHDNGSQTWYGHASKVHVQNGQRVAQGQHIANVGSTGRSTGPHLHYEVRGVRTPVLYPMPSRVAKR